jgi:hypothetical protein
MPSAVNGEIPASIRIETFSDIIVRSKNGGRRLPQRNAVIFGMMPKSDADEKLTSRDSRHPH